MSAVHQLSAAPEPWASVDDTAKHLGIRKDWKFKLSEVDDWVRAGGAAGGGTDAGR